MRVLVAPDKFKGSLTAAEVAEHIAHGLDRAGAECITLPLADGFRPHAFEVADALGRPHPTLIAIDGRTAVVEIADSCGLATLTEGVLAPITASSRGFGEAVRNALELDARMACGAEFFLDLLDFDDHARGADLVVTREGRLDNQTLAGKLPAAVAMRAAPTLVVAVV